MSEEKFIQPELAGGFRDYLPEDMIPRQKMLDTIKTVFERFGFVPLDTPGLEREEVLTGGDPDFRMNIFRAGLEGSKDKLALRFDLTVPLARVVAAYQSTIQKPFKRYQFGRVWRGERQQAGRFREFTQLDADIVGTADVSADAEIVALMYEVMTALGFSDFLVRVNNRKVLNGLAEYAGFEAKKTSGVLRILDKLDKIGWDGVQAELTAADGPNVSTETATALKKFIEVRGDGISGTLDAIGKLLSNSPIASEGVTELRRVVEYVRALGVPDTAWAIDPSVARGLGYYTGPVFETILTKLPSIGSVFSGGRYDGLVSRFSSQAVPATGASVGVDRLFVAMEQLGLIKKEKSTASVLVLNFEPTAEMVCAGTAAALRRGGVSTNLYLGDEKTLKGQLAYAVSQEFPIVVIIGDDEAKRGVAQVKDMQKRTQTEVKQSDIVSAVKGLL